MGTRNLTCVVDEGEYKVAQYGQFDGYPSGVGLDILRFLSDKKRIKELKSNLGRCRFLDMDGADKEFLDEYNKNCPKMMDDEDKRTQEQTNWFFSYIDREIAGKILYHIATSRDEEILLHNNLDFAGDSLFCEWAYVVDFDANTFEIFKGVNHEPLADGERFKSIPTPKGNDYYPVRFVAKFDLDALPGSDDFIKQLEGEEG